MTDNTGHITETLKIMVAQIEVTEVADIPVKGRGGTGVGFHPFVNGEVALLSAAVSATGFVRGKRAVRAEKRAKASVKGSGVDVTPAT